MSLRCKGRFIVKQGKGKQLSPAFFGKCTFVFYLFFIFIREILMAETKITFSNNKEKNNIFRARNITIIITRKSQLTQDFKSQSGTHYKICLRNLST